MLCERTNKMTWRTDRGYAYALYTKYLFEIIWHAIHVK